jgi:hypothetical protein
MRTDPDLTPAAAWQQIQALKQSELGQEFDDEPDDVMPDEPDSAVGKDESSSAGEPTTSHSSASVPA